MKACRRNGYLHWRPDLLKMKMVKSEGQDWAAEKPEGSYRFPSRWLEERGDWLKDGRPVKADIDAIADAEKAAAQMEVDFSRKEGYMQHVKSMGKLKIKDEHAVIDCDEAVRIGADDVDIDERPIFGNDPVDLVAGLRVLISTYNLHFDNQLIVNGNLSWVFKVRAPSVCEA